MKSHAIGLKMSFFLCAEQRLAAVFSTHEDRKGETELFKLPQNDYDAIMIKSPTALPSLSRAPASRNHWRLLGWMFL